METRCTCVVCTTKREVADWAEGRGPEPDEEKVKLVIRELLAEQEERRKPRLRVEYDGHGDLH
jgi:hypothetical protein